MNKKKTSYIIENGHIIKEVNILKFTGGLYTINIVGTKSFLRVHPSRLFVTYDDAVNSADEAYPNTDYGHCLNGQLL